MANPNASLSAERRGTLSIPDVSSFVIEKGKMNILGSTKRKKAKKTADKESEDEVIHPTSMGSRSRPSKRSEFQQEPSPVPSSVATAPKEDPVP